jgi:hypothetical protein
MSQPAPLVDGGNAPEIFCDGAAGALWHNGALRITLESLRADHNVQPAALRRVVVGTVVMPIAAAEALGRMILEAAQRSRQATGNTPQTTHTIQ